MFDALVFWLMRPLAEIAIVLGLTATAMLVYGITCLPGYLKQRRCKHEAVWEDGKCDAWCRACGKNLGFISTWRKKQRV